MAVILSDRDLSVRKRPHPWPRDGYGTAVPTPLGDPGPPRPGAATEQAERGGWALRVDPADWPLHPGDEVTDGARVWVVQSALLRAIPGFPDVDHIAVVGDLDPPETP